MENILITKGFLEELLILKLENINSKQLDQVIKLMKMAPSIHRIFYSGL